jgi:hypothetical protein
MNKQQIIAAFEQAEKDWSEGRNEERYLCCYFEFKLDISRDYVDKDLQPLWRKYITRRGFVQFDTHEERLHAIRQVLNDLKNEQ